MKVYRYAHRTYERDTILFAGTRHTKKPLTILPLAVRYFDLLLRSEHFADLYLVAATVLVDWQTVDIFG
jgi:hypothetical protein